MSPPPRPRGSRSKRKQRQYIPLILVVGEGQTEYNYFATLNTFKDRPRDLRLKPVRGKGGSALDTVKLAIARKKGISEFNAKQGDRVYCVMDVESDAEQASRQLTEARQLAKQKNISIILSNPCFEIWLLTHFEDFKKTCNTADAASKHLFDKSGYTKKDLNQKPQVISALLPQAAQAIQIAKKRREQDYADVDDIINANSATEVYRLVEYLLNPALPAP